MRPHAPTGNRDRMVIGTSSIRDLRLFVAVPLEHRGDRRVLVTKRRAAAVEQVRSAADPTDSYPALRTEIEAWLR